MSDMLEDSVGLIRVARAQDRKYQGTDGVEAKEKKLGNELVFTVLESMLASWRLKSAPLKVIGRAGGRGG
jgi:hypothetical protein